MIVSQKLPISFIQDNQLMSTLRKCHFFLRKALDAIAHNVNAYVSSRFNIIFDRIAQSKQQKSTSGKKKKMSRTSFITRVQFQYSLFVSVSKHLPGKTQDRRRLADARHTGDDDVRHISIFRDDFKALNGLGVANDVVEEDGAVFLDPDENFN